MKKKINKYNFWRLLLNIVIPVGLGALVGFISGSNNGYNEFVKPVFAPPGIVFPIVWTVLYILMGISAYLIYNSDSLYRNNALKTYYFQLIVNLLWSFIFFKFKLLFLAIIWIILLIYLVIKMIIQYKKINKVASYLQIPYLLWLFFALVLNIGFYVLN